MSNKYHIGCKSADESTREVTVIEVCMNNTYTTLAEARQAVRELQANKSVGGIRWMAVKEIIMEER